MVEIKFKSQENIFEEQEESENEKIELLEGAPKETKQNKCFKLMKRNTFEEWKEETVKDFEGIKGTTNFYIGTKDKVEGQISYLTNEEKQKFVLIRVIRKISRDTGEEVFGHYFFDDPLPQKDRGLIWVFEISLLGKNLILNSYFFFTSPFFKII